MHTPPDEIITGHPIVDAQHARIIATTAKLAQTKDVEGCLVDLAGYFSEHFSYEEELMAAVGYPGLPSHHDAHLHLFDRWLNLRARWIKYGEASRMEFVGGITSWLTAHVAGPDRELSEWLRQRRESQPAP